MRIELWKKNLHHINLAIELNGSEMWTPINKDENMLEAFEMWCYYRMVRVRAERKEIK